MEWLLILTLFTGTPNESISPQFVTYPTRQLCNAAGDDFVQRAGGLEARARLARAEIRFFKSAVGGDFRRATARRDAPAFDHVGAIGQRERQACHLVDEQDGDLFIAQAAERSEQVVDASFAFTRGWERCVPAPGPQRNRSPREYAQALARDIDREYAPACLIIWAIVCLTRRRCRQD